MHAGGAAVYVRMLTYADVCYSVKLHPEDVDSVCMLAELLSMYVC